MMLQDIEDDVMDPELELVFWPAGFSDRSYADHLEIAQAGGFTSLAVTPQRAKRLLQSGSTAQDLLDQAAERGLKIGPADGIASWVRNWRSTVGEPALRNMMIDIFDIDLREALDISAMLGMKTAVGVGFFDEGSMVEAEIADCFGKFCDLASPYGISIALEPIPFWGIPDLPLAWRILEAADRENASITIDTWHIEKGTKDFAKDLALLETIPREGLLHVQLSDGERRLRADSLSGDVLFRKFPGEGELCVARILAAVMKRGLLASVGPEIVNAEQSMMSNLAVGLRSGSSTRQVIAQARQLLSTQKIS